MRELEDFHDTYLKYRAKHEMRLHVLRRHPIYKIQIKYFKTISDVKMICSIETDSEKEMYRRAMSDIITYFEGRYV